MAQPGADQVIPNLWVGSAPIPNMDLRPWRRVYFCAEEYQPAAREFPGVQVHYCPLDDSLKGLDTHDLALALQCGAHVAEAIRRGESCLVTCRQGRNRSGFVAAIAVRAITALPSTQIMQLVRRARGEDALANPRFNEYLRALDAFPPSEIA